METRGD
jgi:hypothetical protein